MTFWYKVLQKYIHSKPKYNLQFAKENW